MEQVTESSGNVFADLGFENEEAVLLKLRADLMAGRRTTTLLNGDGPNSRPPSICTLANREYLPLCVASGRNSASTCW